MSIYAGSRVTLKVTFTNPNTGALMSPSSVKLEVTAPGGSAVDYSASVTNPSAGVYQCEYLTTAAGLYAYRWSSIGTGQETIGPERTFRAHPV
jgi:hypothetical protein